MPTNSTELSKQINFLVYSTPEEDLKVICDGFPAAALDGTGVGDLSIICAYQKYKEETPAIEEIRIWSYDKHLEDYHEVITLRNRRNRN